MRDGTAKSHFKLGRRHLNPTLCIVLRTRVPATGLGVAAKDALQSVKKNRKADLGLHHRFLRRKVIAVSRVAVAIGTDSRFCRKTWNSELVHFSVLGSLDA